MNEISQYFQDLSVARAYLREDYNEARLLNDEERMSNIMDDAYAIGCEFYERLTQIQNIYTSIIAKIKDPELLKLFEEENKRLNVSKRDTAKNLNHFVNGMLGLELSE